MTDTEQMTPDNQRLYVEQTLNRTSKQLRDVLTEAGIDPETFDYAGLTIDTCDNCSIWWPKKRLKPGFDGSLLCGFCLENCGG